MPWVGRDDGVYGGMVGMGVMVSGRDGSSEDEGIDSHGREEGRDWNGGVRL